MKKSFSRKLTDKKPHIKSSFFQLHQYFSITLNCILVRLFCKYFMADKIFYQVGIRYKF